MRKGTGVITYAALSKVGGREINEDSVVAVEKDGSFCFVVADGLGGHGKGDVASQAVVSVFKREFEVNRQGVDEFLKHALVLSNDTILDIQKSENDRYGIKTTTVALAIIGNKCAWGHVGDSRLYAFRKNKVYKRTLDHSVPQMLVLCGEIKESAIRGHQDRNKLLKSLGTEWEKAQYELSDIGDPHKYQAFLLCSDGFWESINEKRMCATLKNAHDADEWLTYMTDEIERDCISQDMDNYTAIAVVMK